MCECFFSSNLVAVEHAFVVEHDDGDFAGEFGDEHTFFNGLVAAADNADALILEEFSVAGCAVGNAHAGEFFFARDAEDASAGAGSDDNRWSGVGIFTGLDDLGFTFEDDFFWGFLGDGAAEFFSVLTHGVGQFWTGGGEETRIVYDFAGRFSTAADGPLLDDQRVQTRAATVDTSSKPSRAAAQDNQIVIHFTHFFEPPK